MFLESCKTLIQNNISKPLDEKSLEIMQYVMAALILSLEDIAKEKLPNILKALHVYAENKTVLEMAHEYLHNDQEDATLAHSDACVTRSLSFDENGTFLEEQRNLLLSLSKKNDIFNIISILIHEFIHLLRFGGVQQNGPKLKVKDGIAVAYYDFQTGKLHRKHQTLEEGIVQKYANDSLHLLAFLLKQEKIETEVSRMFLEGYSSSKFVDYYLERTVIETLCINSKFDTLIKESFTDSTIPSPVVQYYNSVMNSSTAFMELEDCLEKMSKNISDTSMIEKYFSKARGMISQFIDSSTYNKNPHTF